MYLERPGEGEGGTHSLLALAILPLTTLPFRDEASFLLLTGAGGGGCSLAAFLSPLIIDHARSFRHGVWLEGAGRAGATEVNVLVLLKRPVG